MVWLRHNAVALVALFLAAALAWFVFWISYLVPERDRYLPHQPIVAAEGEVAEADEAAITLRRVDAQNHFQDNTRLPEGSVLVLAEATFTPLIDDPFCEVRLLLDGQTWGPADELAGASFDTLAGTDSSCLRPYDSEGETGPYDLRWAFLVPEAAWESARTGSVDVIFSSQLPEFLQLEINL